MNRDSGMLTFGFSLLFLVGLGLILGPFLVKDAPWQAKTFFIILGGAVALTSTVLIIITRLYRKTSADEAFVRTGQGGLHCVIDGGALVIPVVHDVIPVSLRTFKLEVKRTGPEALITADSLRADVIAEFYVRVKKETEAILQAATSLGRACTDAHAVRDLIMEKLVSALRTVAATQDLNALHAKRGEFADAVQQIVQADLESNGLSLESVTISALDQAPLEIMQPDQNVFDAQGRKRIAETVQQQRIERNRIERTADKEVKAQDVDRDRYIAEQEIDKARAEADSAAKQAMARAEAEQQAQTYAAQQRQIAETADVQSAREVELARVEQQRQVEVANEQREQAKEVANVERTKAQELADRQRQVAVAKAEQERARAEEERLKAEAEREAALQEVRTVEITKTAEREKAKTIINKEAEVRTQQLEENMEADIKAYEVEKLAEADQNAAEKKAKARITLAQAEKGADTLEADGQRAVEMVPVEVDREKVNVEDARIDVKIKDLEGQAKYESIARELQVELAKIAADKEARIAAARAMGDALGAATVTVWGDPSAVAKMSQAFYIGQGVGMFADGLTAEGNNVIASLLERVGLSPETLGRVVAKGNGGGDEKEAEVAEGARSAEPAQATPGGQTSDASGGGHRKRGGKKRESR